MTGAPQTDGQVAARIDQSRLWQRLMDLARHGATATGGVSRLALSDEEIAARRLLLDWANDLDLAVSTDAIGNLFFRLDGRDPDAVPVLTGSHIDTQPAGGKFDGAFGVVAGFEAIEALRAAGVRPRRPIVVVAWMNEEGSRFAPGMMGSEAFAGRRTLADMLDIADPDGVTVATELARMAAAFPGVEERELGFPVAAFVEAHIEQGPILEAEQKPVGIVTGIQGSRRFRVTVTGENAHAGTAPRRVRKDALFAAADMVRALRDAFTDAEDLVKFTVGRFEIDPNAPSVVPGRAYFSIDLRHPDWPTLKRHGDAVAGICDVERGPCDVAVDEIATAESLTFPDAMQALLSDAAAALGIAYMPIYSAAGHDARQLHTVCPTGMIFVPCEGGLSHNEAEACDPTELAAGTRVLAEALRRLAA